MKKIHMKQYIRTLMLAVALAPVFSSCDYLDKEPDDMLTLDAVFDNADYTKQWLAGVYNLVPDPLWEYMTYEGYGPHGIAVFVDTLTDNTTRTVADVRSVFNKFGGNLGTMGSLAFLFDHKCVFTFKKKDGIDMEELILDLIDYDVEEDYEEDEEEGTITIYGDPKSYAAIQKHLEECGFEDVGGEFTYIPNDMKDVTPEQRETIDKMIERLEEFDDVQTVYTNMKPEEGGE